MSGGEISISLTPEALIISNTGPAVGGDPARFFERFRKHSAASESPGLGLSIVQHICAYHGFGVGYELSEAGCQHTLQVRLAPVSAPFPPPAVRASQPAR